MTSTPLSREKLCEMAGVQVLITCGSAFHIRRNRANYHISPLLPSTLTHRITGLYAFLDMKSASGKYEPKTK